MNETVQIAPTATPAGGPVRDSAPSKKRRRIVLLATAGAIVLAVIAWVTVRCLASVSCTPWEAGDSAPYTESEKVFASMSLSYLVYGCEGCDKLVGTASTILDSQKMGIIIENADIKRTDPADPTTALIDSAAFIRQTVGNFRFLTDLKDSRSSFYGAAFADDDMRTVWIAYAGSVSLTDAVESALLVVGAGLSGQEKCAFSLYETVLQTEEILAGYDLILTGHSLGGALASMVSRMSGAEAVTISGADGLALGKINSIAGEKPDAYRITNYLTKPEGFGFSLKDIVQRMMFWGDYDGVICHTYQGNGMADNAHSVFGFVRFADGDLAKPILPDETIK